MSSSKVMSMFTSANISRKRMCLGEYFVKCWLHACQDAYRCNTVILQYFVKSKDPFTPKRQRQRCDNSLMMLAILFSLKTMESLANILQPHSGATPLFSMRTELQASSQSCRSVDADAWCKRALNDVMEPVSFGRPLALLY